MLRSTTTDFSRENSCILIFDIKALTSFKSFESIDLGGVSFPLLTVTSNNSSPFSSVIISFKRLLEAVSIINVKEDGLNKGFSNSSSGNILRYESMFPASSCSIYFQAFIIKSFFKELNTDLLLYVYIPGNSISRLLESFFHCIAFSLYLLMISAISLSPKTVVYWSTGIERAILITGARGCFGLSMLIELISLI